METNFVPLAVFAFLSFLMLGFSGFGTVIIAIALGAHFYSIKEMLPVLLPVTLMANTYILIRHHRFIDKPILFKKILPFMVIGLLFGIVAFNYFQGDLLKRIFGILIVLLACRELYKQFKNSAVPPPLSDLTSQLLVFWAGIVHGMYASGGPLLVYTLNRLNLPKSVFRSTLSIVWFLLNVIIIGSYVVTDSITPATLKLSSMLIPSLVLGISAGEFLHNRIDEKPFKIFVFLLLLASGSFIIVR